MNPAAARLSRRAASLAGPPVMHWDGPQPRPARGHGAAGKSMSDQEFAAASERLALAREIKRLEAESRILASRIESKRLRLASMEAASRGGALVIMPAVRVPA